MSNKNKETIADIVAEMRHDIADGTVGIWSDFGGEIARCYADRIEVAHKREINDLRDEIARLRTIIDEFGAVVRITDKEFLKGETECPIYGTAIEKNPHWCADCSIGTDGTAVCLFRKCEMDALVAKARKAIGGAE